MKTWILDEEHDAANVAAMRDVITATLAVHAVKPVRPVMDDDDELAALKAENRRLRTALAAIAKPDWAFDAAALIARRALAGNGGGL